MQNLPNPNDFEDWRSWASVLQKQLEEELLELEGRKARVSLVSLNSAKPRGGYPIGTPGDLIIVRGTKPVLKAFLEGAWKDI